MAGNEDQARDIGYLTRAVEELTLALREHMDREEEDRKKLEERLGTIEEGVRFKRKLIRYTMGFFSVVSAILTFQFGEVKTIIEWITKTH